MDVSPNIKVYYSRIIRLNCGYLWEHFSISFNEDSRGSKNNEQNYKPIFNNIKVCGMSGGVP